MEEDAKEAQLKLQLDKQIRMECAKMASVMLQGRGNVRQIVELTTAIYAFVQGGEFTEPGTLRVVS